MRAVLLTSSRFISQRSRFGLYGRQVALTNRAATVPMSELCPAPALGVAPFLNERNGGTPEFRDFAHVLFQSSGNKRAHFSSRSSVGRSG